MAVYPPTGPNPGVVATATADAPEPLPLMLRSSVITRAYDTADLKYAVSDILKSISCPLLRTNLKCPAFGSGINSLNNAP